LYRGAGADLPLDRNDWIEALKGSATPKGVPDNAPEHDTPGMQGRSCRTRIIYNEKFCCDWRSIVLATQYSILGNSKNAPLV
jgi:hypothetical protein